MDAASWGFIGSVIGAIVGASASVVTTAINSRNAFHLHKIGDDLDRAERSRGFQRETLLNTQDTLQDLMRLMARAHMADRDAHRENGQWGRNMLGDELSESTLLANRKMTAFVERITDDALRATVKNLHKQISQVGSSNSIEQAARAFIAVGADYEAAMTQLGSALRAYY
jgi:hypothetical protein